MRLMLFAGLVVSNLCAQPNQQLKAVETVYLLPMSGGLDQFLANRLTKGQRFQVVADPAIANAVFTDRLGEAFEQRLKELYPKPEPEAKDQTGKDKEKESASKSDTDFAFGQSSMPARTNSFGRGKGNVFLVDRATMRVLWSHYKLPKNSRARELDDIADSIVDRLHADAKRAERKN